MLQFTSILVILYLFIILPIHRLNIHDSFIKNIAIQDKAEDLAVYTSIIRIKKNQMSLLVGKNKIMIK